MAPRPQAFDQSGFKPVTALEAQQAHDAVNAPLRASYLSHETGDVIVALPDESRRRLEMLRQRSQDAHALWVPIANLIAEERTELERSRSRLRQLTTARTGGGYGLTETDPQVIDVQGSISKHEGELARLSALEAERLSVWRNLSTLVRSVEEWIRRGRPGGTMLIEASLIDLDEIVKRDEKLYDAIERMRFRLREIAADRRRIESAPFPSADCKARMRSEIENLALRGVPDVSALVEHGGNVGWPQSVVSIPLVAIDKEGGPITGSATGDGPDLISLFCWLHRPALLKALDALVDGESDDGHAMSSSERQMKISEIERDRLRVEREECELIWCCQSAGQSIEFRNDTSPLALLNLELRTLAGGDFLNGDAGVVNVVMRG
jgi:hypothetical protein